MANFSFGSNTFGRTPASTAPSFGCFGVTSTPASGFGFGGLGSTATTTTTGGSGFSFGLGTTTTAPSTGFSFGGFGPTTTSSTGFSFGGLNTTAPSSTPFSFSGLGSSIGTSAPGLSFGQSGASGIGFGGGTGTLGSFGAGLSGIGPSQTVNTVANIAAALSLPIVYNDERDAILAKWNQLQAFWGTGKGYFSSNAPPVEFTPENPFCHFKAVGYSCLPIAKPEDGLVGLTFNKKEQDVRNQQQQIVDNLHRIFGNKPTISVCVEGIKVLPDDKTEVIIYLIERVPTGASRRIPSYEVCPFLEQATVKSQLTALEITNVIPRVAPSKEQLKQYLDNPLAGIDPLLWNQAKLDNPDPERLIPVPMIGFNELHRRLKCQEHETKQHQERLDILAEDIAELQRRHATTIAMIAEHKRKQLELGHRVLKIMVQQEVNRKMGYAIQADEEQLRIQLEAIQTELSAPTQFKGRLKELISQIRMQNHQVGVTGEAECYTLDGVVKEEIRQHLKHQQEGISHLIGILKDDLDDLKIIEVGLKEALSHRR